ncbi:hypothetical protein PIB30_103290, partial [Stylosanthes scabra]|nr:hypothetical protein [Stylosanthes scabra]
DLLSFLYFLHDETDCTPLSMTGCIPQFLYFFGIRWQCLSGMLAFATYAFVASGSSSCSGSSVSCAA